MRRSLLKSSGSNGVLSEIENQEWENSHAISQKQKVRKFQWKEGFSTFCWGLSKSIFWGVSYKIIENYERYWKGIQCSC